jgi:hypothetical protein
MKINPFKIIVSLIIIIAVSCNEPETVVTNVVHPDGSVTRTIEMKSTQEKPKNRFKTSDLQVPFDSTWTVYDSCEISDKGDTTWIRRAVKLFMNADEVNNVYNSDSGSNKEISRHVEFKRRFKWFNTYYRFSEIVDKELPYGYPARDFFNEDELHYFYAPDNMKYELEKGKDSLKYKALSDSISKKTDRWTVKNLTEGWINEFAARSIEKDGIGMSLDSLKAHENMFVKIIDENEDKFDSLWGNGTILKMFIGEADAFKYRAEADSSIDYITQNYFVSFSDYSVRIVMPGVVTGTNGYIDSSKALLWPVKSDFFITETYEMWAESKTPNRWAWIVSGLFLVFVITGLIIRVKKKG